MAKFCFPAKVEFLLSVLLLGPSSIICKRQDRWGLHGLHEDKISTKEKSHFLKKHGIMLILSLPTVLIYRFGVRARMAVSLTFRLCWKLYVQRKHWLFIYQEVELCMVFFTRWKGCSSVAQTDNCEELHKYY